MRFLDAILILLKKSKESIMPKILTFNSKQELESLEARAPEARTLEAKVLVLTAQKIMFQKVLKRNYSLIQRVSIVQTIV